MENRKQKRTAAEWLEIGERQRKSGLSQRVWCERNGVNYQTYVKRIAEVRAAAAQKPEPVGTEWVELSPAAKKPAVVAERFRIKIGTFRVVVPSAFEEAALKRICKALCEIC